MSPTSCRSAWLVSCVALLLPALAPGEAPAPVPEVLPTQPMVQDAVFAVLLGLVESDTYGTLTSEHLGRDLRRRGARSRLPYGKLRELSRAPGQPGRTARVEAVFDGPLDMSVPYSILGYHPGSLRADEVCVFTEWRLGTVVVPAARGAFAIEDVRAFSFRDGRMRIDFDGWLDWLMGAALDDTQVTGIAVFRHRGRWIGMAVGWNDEGQPRSGSFDFQQDKVLMPAPEELRAAARHLRRTIAGLREE